MGKINLYDVEDHDYPNSFKHVSFRTKQVFMCRLCRALTNNVIRINSPGLGVKAICPNQGAIWHVELKEKWEWNSHPHPESYKKEMVDEIENMVARIPDKIPEDISGNPDMKKRKLFFS